MSNIVKHKDIKNTGSVVNIGIKFHDGTRVKIRINKDFPVYCGFDVPYDHELEIALLDCCNTSKYHTQENKVKWFKCSNEQKLVILEVLYEQLDKIKKDVLIERLAGLE